MMCTHIVRVKTNVIASKQNSIPTFTIAPLQRGWSTTIIIPITIIGIGIIGKTEYATLRRNDDPSWFVPIHTGGRGARQWGYFGCRMMHYHASWDGGGVEIGGSEGED